MSNTVPVYFFYDLPIIFLVIMSLVSPLIYRITHSPPEERWRRILQCSGISSLSVVAGGLYLTWRVIGTWNPLFEVSPAPSLDTAIVEFFPGFIFHLTGAFVIGSLFSYLVLKSYRDLDAKKFLLASLAAGGILSLALLGSFEPFLYLLALLFIPAILWEVYYELRRRGSEYTRYFRLALLLFVIQFCALVVYFGFLVLLAVIFSPNI